MFEGWGVGLTLTRLGPAGPDPGPPGVPARPSRLSEVFPAGVRSQAENSLELGRLQGLKAVLAAYEPNLVMELAAQSGSPDAGDSRPGAAADGTADGPIRGTSEFFVDEVAVVLNGSTRAAGRLAADAYVLTGRMPAVWAALADGELDWPRARVFIDVLKVTAAGVAEAVAPRVLPVAVGLSLGKLRARLAREAPAEDAHAAEQRRAEAERNADVRVFPLGDGMSQLATELPSPVAAACWATVDELAWMRKNDGDPRPIGQLRTLVLADLVLRPWDTTRPSVTAHLDVVAPLLSLTGEPGLAPGAVNGQPITAAHLRDLLGPLDAVCPGGVQAPAGGTLQISVVDEQGALLATTSRRELERIARRGCPGHPDNQPDSHPPTRPADRVSTAGCDCPLLGRPAAVDRYTPSPAQRRFVKGRDRTCRHPNCGQPVGRVDLDHVTAYGAGGPTDCANLCCLCRHHHRLKTHARGWRFLLTPGGVLKVTTPGGITRATRPPGLRDRIEQRALPAPAPPPGLLEERPPF